MKQKDILVIIIIFFIFTLTWIASSIWHSGTISTISEETKKNITPIEANFDIKTIEQLKNRQKITPSFELDAVAPTTITLPNLIVPLKKASGEAKLLL